MAEPRNIFAYPPPPPHPKKSAIVCVRVPSIKMGTGFLHVVPFMDVLLCLCFTSHQQRGYLETAPPFTIPCEGREAR